MNSDAFIKKLEALAELPASDKELLISALSNCKTFDARACIVAEGDDTSNIHVVASGLAYRSKTLADGKRQIVAFLLPGDFCDLHSFILKKMDHTVSCAVRSEICEIPKQTVFAMFERPAIARAILLSKLVDEAILREWITNIGQRPAENRLAHLFYELYLRMQIVGRTTGSAFELPVTQTDLADALGLSLVHTNKSLKKLRDENLVKYKEGQLSVLDIDGLRKKSSFCETYLHLGERGPSEIVTERKQLWELPC